MYCMAVTVLVCPNEIVAKSDSVIFSVFFTIPDASPGKSIPVVFPNPSFLIYSFNVSLPIFSPSFINPTLHEFCKIWGKIWLPCPEVFQHLMVCEPTWRLPPHSKVSDSEAIPSSKAVTIVTTLKMEPGSKVSFTKLFLHIFWSFSPSVSPEKSSKPSKGLLGSKSGLFTIASISPLLGFITIIDTLLAWLSTNPFSATFSAIACIFESIVKVTSFPSIGSVKLDIV